MSKLVATILIAGLGERLRPITTTISKPLLTLRDDIQLVRILRLIEELKPYKVYIIVHYLYLTTLKLCKLIKKLFPNCSVIHHYFPPFLKGQELDIYVEGLRLGIEYQGRQHFEPIDFFGGQEGFKLTQKRDNRKQELCKKNGVILEYFDYSEPLSRDYVASKFKKYIT